MYPSCNSGSCGIQYDHSPERRTNFEIRQEAVSKSESFQVHYVNSTPLTTTELQFEPTPDRKHLLMLPKQGMGSKAIMYLNHQTGPLLVVADLFDTLLQRLSHRMQVIVWDHAKRFGEANSFDLSDLVKKVMMLSTKQHCQDGSLHSLKYQGFMQGSLANVYDEEVGDAHCVGGEEDYEETSGEELELNVAEVSGGLLLEEYVRAKTHVQQVQQLEAVNGDWVEDLLKMAECGLLLSALDSHCDKSLLTPTGLRCGLVSFLRSKMKLERISAAHLFGSLLSRDIMAEVKAAMYVEQDILGGIAQKLIFKPWDPSNIISMEQPLFAPKVFSSSFYKLKDQAAILDDVCADHDSMEHFKENINQAPQLLALAAQFWRKQIVNMKETKEQRNAKRRMKKARMEGHV